MEIMKYPFFSDRNFVIIKTDFCSRNIRKEHKCGGNYHIYIGENEIILEEISLYDHACDNELFSCCMWNERGK